MNPLDLRGPEFLALYVPLLLGAVALGLVLRHLARTPDGEPQPQQLALDPIDAAVLAGGPDRGFDAAAARLVSEKALSAEDGSYVLRASGKRPRTATAVERALFGAAQSPSPAHALRGSCAAALDEVRARLVALDLALDAPRARSVARRSALPVWAVVALGLAKVGVGISRDRPVGFLVFLLAVTLFVALAFLGRPPLRTRLGDRALARLRTRHANLCAPRASVGARGASDVALAVALFGATALTANALPELRSVLRWKPPSSGSSSCGSSSGCSSSSCSSSSCSSGCGGCGGGSD